MGCMAGRSSAGRVHACTVVYVIALRVAAILMLFIALGLGVLYAVRAQAPAAVNIPMTQAISEIQSDRVSEVVVEGDRATVRLIDGVQQRVATGGAVQSLLDAIQEYNRVKPARSIAVRYDNPYFYGWPAVAVLFGLLPIAVFVALIAGVLILIVRTRASDPYERLARLADLRDCGALTEEEFQREKRRVLG